MSMLSPWIQRDFILSLDVASGVTASLVHDALLQRADRSRILSPFAANNDAMRVLMLSYPWQARDSPDPHGRVLRVLQAFLRAHGEYTHVFWDYLSMSQQQASATMLDFASVNLRYFDCDCLVLDVSGYTRRAWCVVEIFLSSINPNSTTFVFSPDYDPLTTQLGPMALPSDGYERMLLGIEWALDATVTSDQSATEPIDNARIQTLLKTFADKLHRMHFLAPLTLRVERFRSEASDTMRGSDFALYDAGNRAPLRIQFGQVAECLFSGQFSATNLVECRAAAHADVPVMSLPNTKCWVCALPTLFTKYPRGCAAVLSSISEAQRAVYLRALLCQLVLMPEWGPLQPFVLGLTNALPDDAKVQLMSAVMGEPIRQAQNWLNSHQYKPDGCKRCEGCGDTVVHFKRWIGAPAELAQLGSLLFGGFGVKVERGHWQESCGCRLARQAQTNEQQRKYMCGCEWTRDHQ